MHTYYNILVLYIENHCNTWPLVAVCHCPGFMRTHITVSLFYPNPGLTHNQSYKSIQIITLTESQHTLYVFYFIPLMSIIAKEYGCKCLCESLCLQPSPEIINHVHIELLSFHKSPLASRFWQAIIIALCNHDIFSVSGWLAVLSAGWNKTQAEKV